MAERAKPVRLQLSRKKGFRLQEHSRAVNGLEAVNVTRRGKWGNPFRVGMWRGYDAVQAVRDFRRWLAREPSIRSAENVFGRPPDIDDIRLELGGLNLACFCKLGDPCHADVLLALANPERTQEPRQ